LKGVSGDVIILEEAAYCDPGLVSEVVVPLLSMQQSVLLCISTILDSGNHYSKMMEMTDDYGHNIFETIKITLVCDDCLKTDHPEKCRHKLASMPRWLSSKKVETVRALLAEDPAMLLRESLGISADGSEKAFGTEAIEAMMRRVPNRLRYDVREPTTNVNHVFVACDPSGGGASAFSVASLVQEANGSLQVHGPLSPISSFHMLVSVLHMTTSASGRWAMPLRNEGTVAGSTRASRSATSVGSRLAKCVRTGSSACSANSSAARRAAMPA